MHFTNELPQPTTVHWHGLRVPIQMDGVPGHSQPEVQPGESFTYDFVVPDAGLFWYHPHVMSAAQVGFGLYGALLVEDPADAVGVADELVLVLSDIGIDETGGLESPDSGGPAGMVFGREGNHVLVNGRCMPRADGARGAAALADRQRRQEPLLPADPRRPAVHRDRRRRRAAGVPAGERDARCSRPASAPM